MSSQRTRPRMRKREAPPMAMTPSPRLFDSVTQPTMVRAKMRTVSHSDARIGPCIDTCVRSLAMARDMSVTSGLKVKMRMAVTMGRRSRNIGKA